MFVENHPVADLRPADYNPRQIDDAGRARLRESIGTLGMLKPIICTSAGLIIAGHQRTNALTDLGVDRTPAHVIDGVGKHEEVRFNQLHNSSDVDLATADIRIPIRAPGWHTIEPADVDVVSRPRQVASQASEVGRLLLAHGAWGGAVADPDGRIVIGAVYAHQCKLTRTPLHVRVIDAGLVEKARHFLGFEYGRFSYAHLPQTTWAQSLSQMSRLRGQKQGGLSRLYEGRVIPWLREHPDARVLDFGAGHGDYARRLRGEGFDVLDVEFYRKKRGTMGVDVRRVNRDIDAVCRALRERGPFDLVVCDSVLNSTDRLEAEAAVMGTVNALCKPGGTVAFSGRDLDYEVKKHRHDTKVETRHRAVQFFDEDGYTAMYQRGVWLYQKMHDRKQAEALARQYVGEPAYSITSSSWQVMAEKTVTLPDEQLEAALRAEFDLPLPAGKSYNRADDIVAAWREASCTCT